MKYILIIVCITCFGNPCFSQDTGGTQDSVIEAKMEKFETLLTKCNTNDSEIDSLSVVVEKIVSLIDSANKKANVMIEKLSTTRELRWSDSAKVYTKYRRGLIEETLTIKKRVEELTNENELLLIEMQSIIDEIEKLTGEDFKGPVYPV